MGSAGPSATGAGPLSRSQSRFARTPRSGLNDSSWATRVDSPDSPGLGSWVAEEARLLEDRDQRAVGPKRPVMWSVGASAAEPMALARSPLLRFGGFVDHDEELPFHFEMPMSVFEKASAPEGQRRRIGGIASVETKDRA